jgi:Xaa-Pro dipeptidase
LELYITPDDYTERRNKLATAMERESILAFIAEPSASMTYFTGTQWKLTERAFLFVKTQTDYFWIVPAFELGKAREYIPNGINATNIHVWQEAESPYDVLANVLQLNETIVNRIAVAPETRLFIENSISNMKSVQVVFGGPIETNIRMIKTSREINIMRCANLATKQVLKVLVETGMIPLGVVQSKLKEHVDRALKAVGLTNVWSLVLFGANAAFPHGTKQDLVLGDGDYVLLDIGGELNGYQSDISRTFRVGKGTAEIDEAWKVVQQAQAKAFAAIKAGVNCSTIDSVAREVVEARFPNAFTHRLGHGIGIQGHEDPYFVQGNSVMLAEGMTLSVEPGIYLPGKFGIRLEDIVVVTKDGCEVFGSRPMSVTKPVE